MIKKTIAYLDVINDEPTETEGVFYFTYTLPTQRLYEARTGGNFWKDYENAVNALMGTVQGVDQLEDLSQEDYMKVLPILTDERINGFFQNVIPCMFTKVENGRFVKNEVTADEAEESMWLSELLSVDFYLEIFGEMNSNSLATKSKNVAKKGKKSQAR